MAANPFQEPKGGEGAEEQEHAVFEGLKREETPAAEPGEAEEENEISARVFADDEAEEEPGDERDEEKGEPGKKSGQKPPPLHARNRFQAMRKARDTARTEAQAAKDELEQAQKQLSPLQDVVQKHYAWAKPERVVAEMEFSAMATDGLAELCAANDPDALRVRDKIMKHVAAVRAGERPGVQASQPEREAPAAKPDDTSLKNAKRLATQDIRSVLDEAKIEPRFAKMIVPHVLGKVQNPADLDEDQIVEAVQEWVAQSGFTRKELRGGETNPKARTRVPGGRRAPAGGGSHEEPGGDDKREGPKTLEQWQKNKASARNALFGSIGAR